MERRWSKYFDTGREQLKNVIAPKSRFIDLESALDVVSWNLLFYCMEKGRLTGKITMGVL